MDMTVITQVYCQLNIICQLHVSANTIFGHHQVGYNYRRKLHNTGYTQKNGAVSKVKKILISHPKRAQRTPSAAANVRVSHALPAVRLSCLLRGRGASLQDGVAAGKGFLCAPF